MTVTIPSISINDDNWIDFIAKANTVIDELASRVVTANGDITIGTAELHGTYIANNIVTDTITAYTGSDITINTSLVLSSNNTISASRFFINNAPVTANTSTLQIQAVKSLSLGSSITVSNTVAVTSSSPTIVHQFDKTQFKSGKYTFSISNANGVATAEVLLVHNNSEAFTTEYAIVYSNNSLGTFTANTTATLCRMYFNPTSNNNTVSYHSILVT